MIPLILALTLLKPLMRLILILLQVICLKNNCLSLLVLLNLSYFGLNNIPQLSPLLELLVMVVIVFGHPIEILRLGGHGRIVVQP